MKTCTKIFVAALLTCALGCNGDSPEPARHVVAERTTDAGRSTDGCEERGDGTVVVTATARTRTGKTLALVRTFVPGTEGAWSMTTEISLDGAMLARTTHAGAGGAMDIDAVYGPLVTGVRSARASVSDGLFLAYIDGRPTNTARLPDLDVATLVMADGSPLPRPAFPRDVQAAFSTLLANADSAADSCRGGPPSGRGDPIRRIPISGGDTSVPGHDSDPESSWQCGLCWGSCSAIAAGCILGASAVCASFGPFWWVCEIAAIVACGVAYLVCIDVCYTPGALGKCCPVGCGDVACCADGESCLNDAIGLCCSPGFTTCASRSCCPTGDHCIDTGPNVGTCCKPENVCGNTCCGDLDSCIPSLNLCCGFDTPACGDQCCERGSQCLHGDQCCPAEQVCGDECCPSGTACNTETDECVTCPSGQRWCDEAGGCCPNSQVCSPIPGLCCAAGEYYCDGACRPFGECIH